MTWFYVVHLYRMLSEMIKKSTLKAIVIHGHVHHSKTNPVLLVGWIAFLTSTDQSDSETCRHLLGSGYRMALREWQKT